MIDLPDVRQRKDFDCGHAAVACVADLFGVRRPPDLSNGIDGTDPNTVEALLRRAGFHVCAGTMAASDLKHFTNRGAPVLCPVTLPEVGGHWVVVSGVARLTVYFQCPDRGPSKLSAARWNPCWADETRAGRPYKNWGIAVWL